MKFLAIGSKLKWNALILNLWHFPPSLWSLLLPYFPPCCTHHLITWGTCHCQNRWSILKLSVEEETKRNNEERSGKWREGCKQRMNEILNSNWWMENKSREASEGMKKEGPSDPVSRRLWILGSPRACAYLSPGSNGNFLGAPHSHTPQERTADRKRKLLQHSRHLSNLSLHPLCFPRLSWGAKHVPACLSPSIEALGPKD